MYKFGSMAAQGIEIVSALIRGNFPEWVEERVNYEGLTDLSCGKFAELYCEAVEGTTNVQWETALLRKQKLSEELKNLSRSLRYYRIKILDPQYEDSMSGYTRFMIVRLVHIHNKLDDVVLKMVFEQVKEVNDSEGRGREWDWNGWNMRQLHCLEHPQKEFQGRCLLMAN